jgi:hypothetical protein
MHKKSLLIVLLGCVFLSGCTINNSFQLHYALGKPEGNIYQVKQNTNIAVNVTDKRKIDDPRVLLVHEYPRKIINVAEKPIVDIVKNAIEDGLQQMNFEVVKTNNSRYVFNCNIKDIESEVKGNVLIGLTTTLIINISAYCYLFDNKNQKIIWHDRIMGKGKVERFINTPSDTKNAFTFALTNLIREIQNSETLHMAIKL